MKIISFFFSVDKKKKISDLQIRIEGYKRNIEAIKGNMAQYRSIKASSTYQESGKKNIAIIKGQIAACRAEIIKLRRG